MQDPQPNQANEPAGQPKPAEPAASEPSTSKFFLKKSETNLITLARQQADSIMAIVLSYIAAERLAYHVTPNTRFQLNPEFTEIQVSERPAPTEDPPAPGGNDAPAPAPAPTPSGSGAIREAE